MELCRRPSNVCRVKKSCTRCPQEMPSKTKQASREYTKRRGEGLERRKIMRPLRNGNKLEQNADGEPENDGSKPSSPVGKQGSPWGVGQKDL